MSNGLAIAAVTATLRDLIDKAIGGVTISALPPDRITETNPGNQQLNLFLYQVLPNAAWRNMEIPSQARRGEPFLPPLALTLHYLLTAYGDTDFTGQQLLGRAMSTLHDNCLLGADQIRNASGASVPGNDLDGQAERVRITLQPLSVDEMSKLWPGFQTSYRLSVAYEVSVVLIESQRPASAPLPVLERKVQVFADLSPFPAISAVAPPADPNAVRLGEAMTIDGAHLSGAGAVRLSTPREPVDWDLAPTAVTDTRVQVSLPADLNTARTHPAGVYSVSVVFNPGLDTEHATNAIPIALVPKIGPFAPVPVPASGDLALTVPCVPHVRREQRVSLLLGGREVPADPHPGANPTAAPTFTVTKATAGSFTVRLRVDGVDSVLVDRSTKPPTFDASQRIQIN